MLFRFMNALGQSDGGTYWAVGASSALGECIFRDKRRNNYGYYTSLCVGCRATHSSPNPHPSLSPPDMADYGWSDPSGYDNGEGLIHIVAGDGGGGGR